MIKIKRRKKQKLKTIYTKQTLKPTKYRGFLCFERKKHTIRCAFYQFRQRLNFPGSHPPSIFSAKELNYCVRYGNRCDLLAIVTEYISSISTSYILIFSFSTLNSSFSDLLKAALLKTVQKKFQSKIIS